MMKCYDWDTVAAKQGKTEIVGGVNGKIKRERCYEANPGGAQNSWYLSLEELERADDIS